MNKILLLFAFCLTGLLFSCEDEYKQITPTVADQEISFTIEGQKQTFRGLPSSNEGTGLFTYDANSPENNELRISRAEGTTTVTIVASNLPIKKVDGALKYASSASSSTNITITSTEMSGSIYCPHVEGTDKMDYDGLVKFEAITADGHLVGTFSSGKRLDGNPKLEEGKIDVKLNVQER